MLDYFETLAARVRDGSAILQFLLQIQRTARPKATPKIDVSVISVTLYIV
jgi:hypothetical protein